MNLSPPCLNTTEGLHVNSQVSEQNLIWVDLEMTGLDPDSNRVIEIATIVTDANLNTLAEGPVIAIHQPASVMESMDEWNTRHHGQSGLTRTRFKQHSIGGGSGDFNDPISTRLGPEWMLAYVWKLHLPR